MVRLILAEVNPRESTEVRPHPAPSRGRPVRAAVLELSSILVFFHLWKAICI